MVLFPFMINIVYPADDYSLNQIFFFGLMYHQKKNILQTGNLIVFLVCFCVVSCCSSSRLLQFFLKGPVVIAMGMSLWVTARWVSQWDFIHGFSCRHRDYSGIWW